MIKRIVSMIRKELIQVFRNNITLRMTILSPVIQLLIFGYVAIIDVEDVPTAVLDHSRSAESRELITDFSSSGYFDIRMMLDSEDEIEHLLDVGSVDLVIVIPRNFARDISNGNRTELIGILDGSDSNTSITVGNYFNGVALRYSANKTLLSMNFGAVEVSLPFEARPRVFYNPEMKSIYYIVPGIIAVLVMMLLVILSAISIVRERERGTYEQLTVTPISVGELLIGKTVPFALMGYFITGMVTLIGILWFRVPFQGSIVLLLVTSGLFMISALGLGLFVSSIAATQQQAMMLGMFFLVPQILLSGFIFPIESMPDLMQWFTYLIPTRYFLVIIRGIFLKGVGSEYLWPDILALIAFSVVIFTLSAIRFSRRQKI